MEKIYNCFYLDSRLLDIFELIVKWVYLSILSISYASILLLMHLPSKMAHQCYQVMEGRFGHNFSFPLSFQLSQSA